MKPGTDIPIKDRLHYLYINETNNLCPGDNCDLEEIINKQEFTSKCKCKINIKFY